MVADSGERQAAITNSAPAGAEGGELQGSVSHGAVQTGEFLEK
jgi:hypothetical protein